MKIKDTKSLCPECGKPLDAEVYTEGGTVYIKKTCNNHGEFTNTYWSDDEIYNRVNNYEPSITSVENPCVDDIASCPSNCGLCSKHETSTVLGLIDVTNITKRFVLLNVLTFGFFNLYQKFTCLAHSVLSLLLFIFLCGAFYIFSNIGGLAKLQVFVYV